MKKVLCLIMVLILAFSFSACSNTNTTQNNIVEFTTAKPEAQEISLFMLRSALSSNIVTAKQEYENKLYAFTVEVSEIHENYIKGHTSDDLVIYYDVQIALPSSDIAKLRVRDLINIEGYVEIYEAVMGGNGFKITNATIVE